MCLWWFFAAPVRAQVELKRFEYRQVHMGLQVRVLLYASDEKTAFSAASAAFDEVGRLDAIFSDYRADSELMRLVARAGAGPIGVSSDLFTVLSDALTMSKRTRGAFDPTVGPLVRLWREARSTGQLPDASRLARARAIVGSQAVALDTANQTVSLLREGMQLDLGGIAKGYATDRALDVLADHGIERALIEFGGDVRVGAPPPGASGWQVEVAQADSAHRYLSLAHAAVASSGDTEQFVDIDGIRYSHVVDPFSGRGLSTRTAATVIASDGMTADALATALTILDPAEGQALLDRFFQGTGAYVRSTTGNGATVYSTSWTR